MRTLHAGLALLLLAGCDATLLGGDAGRSDGGEVASPDGARPLDAGPPRPVDAGAPPTPDAGPIETDAGPPPPPDPDDLFFVGNSFTFGGPIPTLVRDLAVAAGHPEPRVEYRAVPGRTLEYHRADSAPEGAPARVAEGWDVLVLQENSLRPTDSLGDPAQFKEDATWFHDLARGVRPECRVILYETWARRAGHSVYASAFTDPADMQEQLRFHYFDAAERYLPTFSTFAGVPVATVAPVGDAWELQLAMGEPPRLHADDDWHAGPAGQYLNALVIYGTIYGRRTRGLAPLGVDEATASLLQRAADAVTGAIHDGPLRAPPPPIADGATVRADVGPRPVAGWPALTAASSRVGPVDTVDGAPTGVRFSASGFSGTQTGGSASNALGWPGDVSADSLWVGSFDGHAAALGLRATVLLRGLPEGAYTAELFASRDGTDSGNGRLTRYRIGAAEQDLEVADNTARIARFEGVRPDELGEVLVEVAVSPAGAARFAYLGAIVLTRSGP